MKKVISCILVLVCVLTVLTACGNSPRRLIGTWTGETSVLGVVAKYSFTFNEDGTGSMTAALDIGVATTYTVDGDQLSITYSVLGIGTTKTYTFSFEGDNLILNDGSVAIVLTKAG